MLKRLGWIGIGLGVLLVASGCLASVIRTEHRLILGRFTGEAYELVADDDPLQVELAHEILDDPYLNRLLTLYSQATDAFVSTGFRSPLPQTVANKPVVVLGTAQPGLLRDIRLHTPDGMVSLELALGLGEGSSLEWPAARRNLPRALAPLLLELLGVRTTPWPSEGVPLDVATLPALALEVGWGAALDAGYAEERPELLLALYRQEVLSPAERDRLWRYAEVPRNGLRWRFAGGLPTATTRPPEEAMRTPGMVGTFFYRLLRRTSGYYPQRFLLWQHAFKEDFPFGKTLLAFLRMPRYGEPSVQGFITSYAEAFPADRATVEALAREVFGTAHEDAPRQSR